MPSPTSSGVQLLILAGRVAGHCWRPTKAKATKFPEIVSTGSSLSEVQVASNISAVIGRAKRLQSHGIPTALRRTLDADFWRKRFREEATATLSALAAAKQREIAKAFVDTLMVTTIDNGVEAVLRHPTQGGLTYQKNLDGGIDPLTAKSQQDFSRLLGDIYEFVATEKRWDVKRDGDKTAENIMQKADWLTYEMLAPVSAKIAGGENAGKTVRDVFLPRIADFLNAKSRFAGELDTATANAWLSAILAAWRKLVRDVFPQRFHESLRTAQ
ncbi:MAG: hypothetical protein KGL39_50105 [Patescibacteria group bacterium]|nr:hypothetical protein [Patescibacteria group bacterium]